MNVSGILDFLKLLAANNNREWFHIHKSEYIRVQSDFESLLGEVIVRLSLFDESIAHIHPAECTYQIYRDTRFSADKSPYKNHIGGYINARGKKSNHCGYYIHLEPGNCMLAGGSWCMPSHMLKAVRQSVCDNIEAYRAIVEDEAFRTYFPVVGEGWLKTNPKGFPKDFPYSQYIRCKDYTVSYHIPDSFFDNPDFMDEIVKVFIQLKRFADFTNSTIDELE